MTFPSRIDIITDTCRDAEIGIQGGLKNHWWQHREGSSPSPGTFLKIYYLKSPPFVL